MRSEAKDAAKDQENVSESIEPYKLWNPDVALRRMGADTELLHTMVDYFLEDSLLLLPSITILW